MSQVLSGLAHAAEGASVATGAFRDILGLASKPDEVVTLQSMLAQGQSQGYYGVDNKPVFNHDALLSLVSGAPPSSAAHVVR